MHHKGCYDLDRLMRSRALERGSADVSIGERSKLALSTERMQGKERSHIREGVCLEWVEVRGKTRRSRGHFAQPKSTQKD